MRRFLTVLVPTALGVLIGIALAQQPFAQSTPLKPTTFAEAIVSAGEVEEGMTGAWVLSNDGTLRLCTGRLLAKPEKPVCSEGVAP